MNNPGAAASGRVLLSHPLYELARRASPEGARFTLSGDVDAAAAARVLAVMEEEIPDIPAGSSARLNLEVLELTDGVAAARMVDLVRLLLGGGRRVEAFRPPQTLAHAFYRTGMLEGAARLALVEPRREEGAAS